MNDLDFMKLALIEAQKAEEIGEVPIGAVVVCDGRVVATGHNRRECDRDASAHAEFIAMQNACQTLGRWRLSDCTVYVTLEPCPMCAGMMINSRVARVVFGASDEKAGACGSVCNLFAMDFNHRPTVTSGVMAEECTEILQNFFKKLRQKH